MDVRRARRVGSGPRRRSVAAAAAALAVVSIGAVSCVPQPTAGISCGWGLKVNRDALNVAYPDATATYFGTRFNLTSGQQLILSGTYPFARYMSLHTYTAAGNVVDHLADTRIAPDAGSDNPFTDVAASADPAQRRWTVKVSPDFGAFDGSNGDNLLAAPTNGTILLRVYVPDDAADLAGSVPLPALSVRNVDGTVTPVPTCATSSADPSVIDLINLFGPATDLPAADPPVFSRPLVTAGLYPNRDNAYLGAIAAHVPGRVVVVRGTAPTTPDTMAGEPAATPSQLRYWSFCTNEYRKPYPVSSCVVDHDVPLAGDGTYTIVVSTPADRPANATTANGVAWVDWGSTSTNLLMMFRHMLPAADFPQNVFAVAPGQPATSVMGEYAPIAVSCDAVTFETGGAAACGLG